MKSINRGEWGRERYIRRGRNERKVTKLKGRRAREIGENCAKMLDISEPKKDLREEAKKKRNGSYAATGGGKFESPLPPPSPN